MLRTSGMLRSHGCERAAMLRTSGMLRSHGCERAAMLRTSGMLRPHGRSEPSMALLHECIPVRRPQRAASLRLAVTELNKLSVYRIHIIFFCHTVKVSFLFSAICIIPSGHPITIRSRICLH
jgi:hypothetical protein